MPTIKTRQTSDGRSTMNSEKRGIVDEIPINKKKKKLMHNSTIESKEKKQKSTVNENSGTSSSSSGESENENEKAEETKIKAVEKTSKDHVKVYKDDEDEIVNENGTDVSDDDGSEKLFKDTKRKNIPFYLSVNRRSKVNLYVRYELFKKIKILGNEHLRDEGQIVQELLKRIQYDPNKDNFNICTQECKRVLKTTMCSRRGYVKKQLGKKLRGMLLEFLNYFSLNVSKDFFEEFLKSGQINFSFIHQMKHFYRKEFVNDIEVRTAWYYFCFHFLPICSKEFKESLQDDLLKKKEIIFKTVTTSDEALVQFFIILWMPKLKIESENDWQRGKYSTGDQELRARIDEYSLIYQTIQQFKSYNEGEFAASWNDVFWEEVEKRHPKLFNISGTLGADNMLLGEDIEVTNAIPLPGIDEDNVLPKLIEKHKLTVAISESTEKPLETSFTNVTGI